MWSPWKQIAKQQVNDTGKQLHYITSEPRDSQAMFYMHKQIVSRFQSR